MTAQYDLSYYPISRNPAGEPVIGDWESEPEPQRLATVTQIRPSLPQRSYPVCRHNLPLEMCVEPDTLLAPGGEGGVSAYSLMLRFPAKQLPIETISDAPADTVELPQECTSKQCSHGLPVGTVCTEYLKKQVEAHND